MAHYNYSIQRAHHDRTESDRYSGSGADILRAFDDFDWNDEVTKANETQKCSPTVSVEGPDGKLVWVSGYGEPGAVEFVSEYRFHGTRSILFGLMKSEGNVSLDTQSFSQDQARKALELFVNADYSALESLYR